MDNKYLCIYRKTAETLVYMNNDNINSQSGRHLQFGICFSLALQVRHLCALCVKQQLDQMHVLFPASYHFQELTLTF